MKKIAETIFRLPSKAVITICIAAVPITVAALAIDGIWPPFQYFAYLFSAYALVLACLNTGKIVQNTKSLIRSDRLRSVVWFRKQMEKHKYTALYLHSKKFRGSVALFTGLFINSAFALYKCISGLLLRSAWLGAIGLYYIILSVIRAFLAERLRRAERGDIKESRRLFEYRNYRLSGILILFLTIGISSIAIQVIVNDAYNRYSELGAILSAAFTFYCFISAIVNVVSFSKLDSPLLLASKNLSLVGAAFSMFSLQTVMIPAFGDDSSFRIRMNLITGAFVTAFCISTSLFMIIKGERKMKG